MKQLITMLLLAVATMGFAQGKKDLMIHSGSFDYLSKIMKKTGENNHKKAFIMYRMLGLKDAVDVRDDQMESLVKFFADKYQPLQDAWAKYKNADYSDATKKELITLLVSDEEEFRKLLPSDQLVAYLRYGDKIVQNIPYADNFLSDYKLSRYKNEMQ